MRISIQMLRIIIFLVITFLPVLVQSQPPAGYYASATGKGYELKTSLHNIIKDHDVQLYSQLWQFFASADIDLYYETDGTLLDIYSENPTDADPYNFVLIDDQCGNYSGEGDCYNREHLVPNSVFGRNTPMDSDVHHIFPTDGWVNNRRANFPFGNVSNPTYISLNGSRLGPNRGNGYNGTVFEVIDEFKGDVARALFYFATRYENQIASWDHPMFNKTSDQVFEDWFLSILLEWNETDPVSEREINRNNIAYEFQGNRNPFIDNQEWVNEIWNPSSSHTSVQQKESLPEIYPNPNFGGTLYLRSDMPVREIIIFTLQGIPVYHYNNNNSIEARLELNHLPKGFYFIYTGSDTGNQMRKLILQ